MDNSAKMSSATLSAAAEGPAVSLAHLQSGRGLAALKGVFWSSINTLVPAILGLAVFVVSSRFLTPTDFGLVGLAASIGMFASAIAPGAFAEALIQRSKLTNDHVDTVFWLCAASGLALFCLLLIFASPIASLVGQPSIALLIQVFALRFLFDLLACVPNALIARSMLFNLIALRTTIASTIAAVCCFALLYLGYGLWALVVSQVAASFISFVVAFWAAKHVPAFRFDLPSLKDVASYGIFASGTRFVGTMKLDQILLGSLAGPAVLGIYNFARRLLTILNSVMAGTLASVSHSLFSSLQESQAKVREAFLLATFASLTVSFPVFAGLALISDELIPLVFGEKWLSAIVPVQALCAVGLIASVGIVQSSLIASQGKTNWWFYYQAVQQGITLGIILAFHSYGVEVLTIAIAIKTYLLWPISFLMSAVLVNVSVWKYLQQMIPAAVSVLSMVIILIVTRDSLSVFDPYFRLALQILIGGAVYVSLVSILSFHRIKHLVQVFQSRRKKH